jgi:cytochrome c oxidase cbb3-type subunit II
MRNGFTFFLGLFLAIALAWAGIVLGSHAQLSRLAPYFDENEGKAFPERMAGVAASGQLVYQDLGCAACHTQQVRRPDFGSDKVRGWGDRQSVARDYVNQPHVQLGENRVGPDLANFGARPLSVDAERLTRYLYDQHGGMPAYRFLFEERKIIGERSAKALNLLTAPEMEVVPTHRAEALVAYLQSLNNSYEYPEAKPVTPAGAANEREHGAAKPEAKEGAQEAAKPATKEGAQNAAKPDANQGAHDAAKPETTPAAGKEGAHDAAKPETTPAAGKEGAHDAAKPETTPAAGKEGAQEAAKPEATPKPDAKEGDHK